jgi:hypothetical protein
MRSFTPFQARAAQPQQVQQQRQQVTSFAPQYQESYQPIGRKRYPTKADIDAGRKTGAILFGGLGVAYGFCGGPLGIVAGAAYGASLGMGMAASLGLSKNAAWAAAGVGAVALGMLGAGGGGLANALIAGGFGAFNGYQLGGFYAAGGMDKYLK